MEGSTVAKVFRVARNLITHPKYVGPYLSSKRSTPIELELPWFSYAAIDFLERWIRPEHEIFEFGSGGSTLFFAKRARSVKSVEENEHWYKLVRKKVDDSPIKNVDLRLSNWSAAVDPSGFERSDYTSFLSAEYDIIVVDGQCHWPSFAPRLICFEKARSHVRPGGIIIVDDSWRYDRELTSQPFIDRKVFKSVGPCRPGVTTTTVYFF